MEEKDVNISGDPGEETSTVEGRDPMQEAKLGEQGHTEKLQQELAEMKDKYLRQVAEFDNFRKRSAKERLELIQTAGKDVITSLLDGCIYR